jgi:predicted TIM-barrel fold metal-dependent hydrolase
MDASSFPKEPDDLALRAEGYGKFRRQKTAEAKFAEKGHTVRDEIARLMPPSFVSCTAEPEVLIEYMSWVGVDKAVLLPSPGYCVNNDEYFSEVVRKYRGRFVALSAIDPRESIQVMIRQLEYAVEELKLRGVKFEPPKTPFRLKDSKYLPFWKKLVELDGVLAIDLGWIQTSPYNFQLDGLRKVLHKFPEMKTLVLHLGVSKLGDLSQKYPFPILQQTLALSKYPYVLFGLAGLDCLSPSSEYPYPREQEIVKATYERVGAKKLFWGSDFPTVLKWCTYKQWLDLIKRHCTFIPPDDKKMILGENLESFFHF